MYFFFLVLQSLSILLTLCLWLHSAMKSCTWIRTRNMPAVYSPYFFARVKKIALACQGNISNMLLCEYLLPACQKKVTGISLWGECHEEFFFFSFHVENFLQMFLLRYCSCNSLRKFTWHKCTAETHFHPRNTWQTLFSWNECRIFSYCEGGREAAWSIGILFGRLGFQFTMGFS